MLSMLRPALAAAMLMLVPAVALAQSAPAAAPPGAATGGGAATAATGEGGGRPLAACRADIEKLCPGAVRGDRRRCLNENAAKLSPECTAARADIEVKAKAMREACAGDVRTHCAEAGKRKGGEGIGQCLRANEAKLSVACTTAMKARYTKG
jgi:hypothetical protein